MTESTWRLVAALAILAAVVAACAWPRLRSLRFTLWIAGGVGASLIYPNLFLNWFGLDTRNTWVLLLLLQAVMFGMGSQMSLRDFAGLAQAPRGVLVGLICHFSVMPAVGYLLTRAFRFPPEIAAGVILVGSCSSGLSSNVMAYFAGSNLALSVTVTALSTMAAPLMTPVLVKLLAGALVHIDVVGMMLDIIRIVIVPIGAALLADYLRHAGRRVRRFDIIGIAACVWLGYLACGGWARLQTGLGKQSPALVAIGMAGFVAELFAVGIAYFHAVRVWPRFARAMPVLSMAGIIYVTTVSTAAGRDNLLKVGLLLAVCSMLHNTAGYIFGYWLSRAAGLDKNSSRSVAFEVGLQNGGMASGLAATMGKLATMGLAPAIFSAWMNVSGSLLANYWRRRPVGDGASIAAPTEPNSAVTPT